LLVLTHIRVSGFPVANALVRLKFHENYRVSR
jgi:hypothetical protein